MAAVSSMLSAPDARRLPPPWCRGRVEDDKVIDLPEIPWRA
ncbi:hypothetical protein [Bradyrhizobium sp. USDA 3315]